MTWKYLELKHKQFLGTKIIEYIKINIKVHELDINNIFLKKFYIKKILSQWNLIFMLCSYNTKNITLRETIFYLIFFVTN